MLLKDNLAKKRSRAKIEIFFVLTNSNLFLKKWANPDLFFIYFRLSKHTIQFLQQINVKKCPSSIWCWDSNSWPLEHESHLITTRPGPLHEILLLNMIMLHVPLLTFTCVIIRLIIIPVDSTKPVLITWCRLIRLN